MIKLLFVILAIVETFTISIEDHRKNDKLTTHSIQRWKRQSTCSATQHRCRDGTCIRLDQRCDGQVHCPDGSDEIHPECRNMRCPEHLFRCTYGACVDGTAACNGVKDCADNSDELIPKCRNENVIFGDKFKCNDGEMIDLIYQCDGIANCKDRSDETIQLCGSIICPSHLFQCAYGACVDEGSECDDIDQCADESDESDILCNRKVPRKTTTTEATKLTTAEPTECIVPYNPDNGIYTSNGKHYVPGRTYEFVSLNVTCRPGYKLIGKKTIDCYYGEWSIKEYPKCIRACRVTESPSIVYRCQESSYTGSESTRDCEELEVEGTIIQPECRRPNYYSPTDLQYMFCVNGDWNYYPKCLPEMESQFQFLFDKMNIEMQKQTIELTNTMMKIMEEKLKPIYEENKILRNKVEILEKKIEYLEREKKTNNIIIHELKEDEKSVWELFKNSKNNFSSELNLNLEDWEVSKIYRIEKANKGDTLRSTVISLVSGWKKSEIMRYKKTLKELYLTEDNTNETLEKRNVLQPKIIDGGKKGHIAYIEFDRTVVKKNSNTNDKKKTEVFNSPQEDLQVRNQQKFTTPSTTIKNA